MLLSLNQAAERLGRSVETLRTQIKQGRLEATKFGRDWVVEESEVERYRVESVERGPGRPSEAAISAGVSEDRGQAERLPGDSAEQREAERWLVDQLEAELGVALLRKRCPPTKAVAAVELDGLALGERPVLCEAWAHVGPPKPAQKNKVLADALRLVWVEAECFPGVARKYLIFGDDAAARRFREGSWASQALRKLGVEVKVYPFDPERRHAVEAAQERQGRTFAGSQG